MFLDTSGLLCIHDARDHRHPNAASLYRKTPKMFLTNYVLTEFIALAHVRGVPRAEALSFVDDLQKVPRVQTVWVSEALHQRGMALLRARLDKTYSLCDAVSFVLMSERGETDALTTDRHFEQEGLVRLLVP